MSLSVMKYFTYYWSSCYNAMFCWETLGPGIHVNPPLRHTTYQIHICKPTVPPHSHGTAWWHPQKPHRGSDLALACGGMDRGPLGCLVVSGTRALMGNPLNPVFGKKGHLWIGLVLIGSTYAWLDLDLGNLEARSRVKLFVTSLWPFLSSYWERPLGSAVAVRGLYLVIWVAAVFRSSIHIHNVQFMH